MSEGGPSDCEWNIDVGHARTVILLLKKAGRRLQFHQVDNQKAGLFEPGSVNTVKRLLNNSRCL